MYHIIKIKCITLYEYQLFSTLIIIIDHQILILEWFLKGHVTLKTGVMMRSQE